MFMRKSVLAGAVIIGAMTFAPIASAWDSWTALVPERAGANSRSEQSQPASKVINTGSGTGYDFWTALVPARAGSAKPVEPAQPANLYKGTRRDESSYLDRFLRTAPM